MALDLPVYDKAPVVERILIAQFEPIPGFTNSHIGAFWNKIGGVDKWMNISDAPVLPQNFERFGDETRWQNLDAITFGLSPVPAFRLQVKNEKQDRMIQIENGHFIYNWLVTPNAEYVRYEVFRQEFDDLLKEFQLFLKQSNLPEMRPNQWEVTYLNHLPQGTVWNDQEDWKKVFAFEAVPSPQLKDCSLETFNGQWICEIGPGKGRLYIKVQHGWIGAGGKQVLIFNLTARGPIKEGIGAVDTLEEGLNLGHRIIVSNFKALSSPKARTFWEEQL